MTDPAYCEVVGRWRITGSDMSDQDFLDLANRAHFTLDDAGHGEIEFGAVHLNLDIEYGRHIVFFRFAGFDEDNEAWGDTVPPKWRTTARWRARSTSSTVTTPHARPSAKLLQQPARPGHHSA